VNEASEEACVAALTRACRDFCKSKGCTVEGEKCVRKEPTPGCALDGGRWKKTYTCQCKCIKKCGCDCYFSKDCQGSAAGDTSQRFCEWNKGAKGRRVGMIKPPQCLETNEDVCDCMVPKPPDRPADQKGKCSRNFDREQQQNKKNPCDGICLSAPNGSDYAYHAPAAVAESFDLWARAIIDAAAGGGGLPDHALVHEAEESLGEDELGYMMGRHVESLLIEMAGEELFVWHPTHPHGADDHTVGDLSHNPCLVEGLRRLAAAQVAEIISTGAAEEYFLTIPRLCPGIWSSADFCSNRESSLDPATCLLLRVQAFATYVTTLPVVESESGAGGCPGACTLPDGVCDLQAGSDCLSMGGSYLGDDTSCDAVLSPADLGACCYLGPECINGWQGEACLVNGGQFYGPGSTCDTLYAGGTCLPPPRACCIPPGCLDGLLITDCTAMGGFWFPSDVPCSALRAGGLCPCLYGDIYPPGGDAVVEIGDVLGILEGYAHPLPCISLPAAEIVYDGACQTSCGSDVDCTGALPSVCTAMGHCCDGVDLGEVLAILGVYASIAACPDICLGE